MRLLTSLAVSSMLVISGAAVAEVIHPYTQQNWDQWQGLMDAADAAVAKKAPADEMLKALEATEAFFSERAQPLQRHPDYPKGLEHQLAIRLSLVKLQANMGFLYAKTAADKRNGTLLTQPGGAFDRLTKANDLLKTYLAVKGADDESGQKMVTYVAELRKQADNVGTQLNAAGISVVPESATPIDHGTEGYFRQWWEKLEAAEKAFASNDFAAAQNAYHSAQAHQNGWKGWLTKHSEYEKTLARQEALGTKLLGKEVSLEIAAALTQAKKGFEEKNPNYFSPSSGVYQRLGGARSALTALAKAKGDHDPEVMQLTRAIADADAQVRAQGNQLEAAAIAGRAMPVDVYAGADKAALKASILAHWQTRYPKDKVLGVRFFETAWTRETNWKLSINTAYLTDYSWLPVKVVVQTSDDVASLFPAFANTQQQGSGKTTISDDRSGSSYVVGKMLIKNVKF
jgi:hypothetical protein